MKFSKTFINTTKDAPKDATLPSHQFLVRAGFINQVGAGLYNYMPLGKIVLDKIRAVVKEELDNAGCVEVGLSFVTPMELWEESGRASKMGLEMLRIKDRKDADFVLSPTNEEAIVTLVKNRITSYKDLPINLYQINTKFRDEARPRFGLMRGREFLMKDGYSFHESTEDMQREFALMEETYKRIFTRLGLDFRVVEADSGAIGGNGSKEFMVIADSGEDTLVVCDSCEYGANIEAVYKETYGVEELPDSMDEEVVTELKAKMSHTCKCGGHLNFKKGIEVGHIFQLGTVYSAPLNANFLDANGKSQPFIMGTYGIGVSRLLAAIIEQNHDEKGCKWTKESTPYMVDIIVSNGKNKEEQKIAEKIYKSLTRSKIYKKNVLLDDRVKTSFGFKMGDFELIGIPLAIIIGKNLRAGKVEILDRESGTKKEVNILQEKYINTISIPDDAFDKLDLNLLKNILKENIKNLK